LISRRRMRDATERRERARRVENLLELLIKRKEREA
jgi:hypothetical protein